jgi:hypothetical protein
VTKHLATICVLGSSFLVSCDKDPSKELLSEYGQVEYSQFTSPIHRDVRHDIPGLDLWWITPFRSVEDRTFVVGTDPKGKVIESSDVFLRLYRHDMTADQAAELSIQISNNGRTPGERHALRPKPHTLIGSDRKSNAWVEPPRFEGGNVLYWIKDDEDRYFRASTSLATGALSSDEFWLKTDPDAGLDKRDAAPGRP